MWQCPECKREFKNRNQPHTCGNFTIEKTFENYPPEIFTLFNFIHEKIKLFDGMKVSPVKNGVMYSVYSTFLAIKPHSKFLAVEFACGTKHDEFPVEKCVPISKSEFAHITRIEQLSEVDHQLITWIKEAYLFNCSKKQ